MKRRVTRSRLVGGWLVLLLCISALSTTAAVVGPENGALVIVGGGAKDATILRRFLHLAGGPASLIVVIPTASEKDDFDGNATHLKSLHSAGATNLVTLHTRDRMTADSDAFVAPLKKARGVWLGGGRQWRLVDSYLNTKTQRELFNVLARGGVIGGSSAGATIQGSYLVRGAREGNQIMMAPGYEEGFGFLKNVAIDQHLLARKREEDLLPVIARHPHLLGLGIDEDTALVVRGDQCEVIGRSKVAIYDPQRTPPPGEKAYYFLEAGDRFDLATRRAERKPR